jgi:oligosaccharide repeat unit polymerase
VIGPTTAALVCSIALIGWAAAMRAVSGTWLNPSALFALWWCFAGILPLIVVPNEPVGTNAIFWLLAASIAVCIGAVVGNGGLKTRRNVAAAPATDRELFVFGLILAIATVLGMASNVAFIAGSSVSFADVFDLEKLVVVSNSLYVQRYDEVAPSPPALSQALLPFVYLAPAIGGILFVLRREKKWKFFALLSFLPSVAVTILQTTKAAVLFSMTFWLSGYFAARLRAGKLAVFTKGHLLTGVIGAAVITLFFFGVGLARMASTDLGLLNLVLVKLSTGAFGHMTVFSGWLAEYWKSPFNPSLGTTTFAGPLEKLGYGVRIPGIFPSVVDLVAGETSNIYTGFRPLIEDFTIPGALVVMSLLGFIGGAGYRNVTAGKWSGFPLLLIAYITIVLSPITWLWLYNSLTATVFTVALLVWLIRVWRGSGQTALA